MDETYYNDISLCIGEITENDIPYILDIINDISNYNISYNQISKINILYNTILYYNKGLNNIYIYYKSYYLPLINECINKDIYIVDSSQQLNTIINLFKKITSGGVFDWSTASSTQ